MMYSKRHVGAGSSWPSWPQTTESRPWSRPGSCLYPSSCEPHRRTGSGRTSRPSSSWSICWDSLASSAVHARSRSYCIVYSINRFIQYNLYSINRFMQHKSKAGVNKSELFVCLEAVFELVDMLGQSGVEHRAPVPNGFGTY